MREKARRLRPGTMPVAPKEPEPADALNKDLQQQIKTLQEAERNRINPGGGHLRGHQMWSGPAYSEDPEIKKEIEKKIEEIEKEIEKLRTELSKLNWGKSPPGESSRATISGKVFDQLSINEMAADQRALEVDAERFRQAQRQQFWYNMLVVLATGPLGYGGGATLGIGFPARQATLFVAREGVGPLAAKSAAANARANATAWNLIQKYKAASTQATKAAAWEELEKFTAKVLQENPGVVLKQSTLSKIAPDTPTVPKATAEELAELEKSGGRVTRQAVTAERAGVQLGREHLLEKGHNGVTFKEPKPGYVNTLEPHGIDDVLIGSDENIYLVEYKGGTGKLSPGQMESAWVNKKIEQLNAQGNPWGKTLEDARRSGKLRGVSVETPYAPGKGAGETRVAKEWDYKP